MSVEDAIRKIVAGNAKLSRPAASLTATTDLFEAGLDSQAVVNVMLAVEEHFGFEFPEDRLNRASFATLSSIADIVASAGAAA